MRSLKYLNVILTINAALLAGLIWTQVAGTAVVAQASAASDPAVPNTGGIPNASEQRNRMIEALEHIQQTVEASNRLLADGDLRVEVVNFDEMTPSSGSNPVPPPAAPISRSH